MGPRLQWDFASRVIIIRARAAVSVLSSPHPIGVLHAVVYSFTVRGGVACYSTLRPVELNGQRLFLCDVSLIRRPGICADPASREHPPSCLFCHTIKRNDCQLAIALMGTMLHPCFRSRGSMVQQLRHENMSTPPARGVRKESEFIDSELRGGRSSHHRFHPQPPPSRACSTISVLSPTSHTPVQLWMTVASHGTSSHTADALANCAVQTPMHPPSLT